MGESRSGKIVEESRKQGESRKERQYRKLEESRKKGDSRKV